MRKLKILLVDDHSVVRAGVRRLLEGIEGAEILEAETGHETLGLFRSEKPDLVLLDLNMEGVGGLELLRRLILEDKKARVIVFTMHSEPIYAARALKLGARGYVTKSASADELVAAVKQVSEGRHYIEVDLASKLAIGQFDGEDPLHQLTTREVEILRLLGDGKSLTAIAETLGVSYKTVANTCSLIKNKLGLQRTADLIRVSLEHLHS
ncbi:MAG: LuxR family transcriptional regulator [Alphaproteobacteria bacterium BRH_c36]|nr:MAG: LuxR family transcriptional regulator [Alphaproteobacteria bacterium BRH_c36]